MNIYAETLDTERFRIPSESAGDSGIVVKMMVPGAARFPEGAPVAIHVPGGFCGTGLNFPIAALNEEGFIDVTFNFPGSGQQDDLSGGVFDNRGPICLMALRDVVLFAMGKKADDSNRYIGDVCTSLTPLNDNVGLIGYSNGGNTSLVTTGFHGNDLNGLAWLVNYESPVGDGMITTEAGSWDDSTINPLRNPAYDPDSGMFDLSSLKYAESISINQHPASTVSGEYLGGLFFDIDGNGQLDEGTDFVPFPLIVGDQGNVKAYYSVRLTREAYDKEYFPPVPPAHIATLAETETFWYYRNGGYWLDDIVAAHPDLMFMVVASERDHMQTAIDHPHILIQYAGLLQAGVGFARLNPDISYVRHILGSTANAADNDAYTVFNHFSIRNALEPCGTDRIDLPPLITAAACEMADRVNSNNVSKQIEPAANNDTEEDDSDKAPPKKRILKNLVF